MGVSVRLQKPKSPDSRESGCLLPLAICRRVADIGLALKICAVALVATNWALASAKDDAEAFLARSRSQLATAFRCFNYEALFISLSKGKPYQQWQRVRSGPEGLCVYSGSTFNPKLQISDPAKWQSDDHVTISENNFYTVEVENQRYSATVTHMERLQADGSTVLDDVEKRSGAPMPGILKTMLGETIVQSPVLDFLRRTDSQVLSFTEEVRSGRRVKALIASGRVARARTRLVKSLDRFSWEYDAETGCCLHMDGKVATRTATDLEVSVEYSEPKGGVGFPTKVIMNRGTPESVRTTYYRACSISCALQPNEYLVSYHGIKEPTFPDDERRARAWLIWAEVGVMLIIVGVLISRYVKRSHTRRSIGANPQ